MLFRNVPEETEGVQKWVNNIWFYLRIYVKVH